MNQASHKGHNGHDVVNLGARSERTILPYGFRVHYEALINGRTQQKWFRLKGPQAQAQRMALVKEGFVRITNLEPFTREEWHRVFGNTERPFVART